MRKKTDTPPVAVQLQEAAKMLGLSARTVRRLVHQNKIAHARVGNRILVRVDELDRVLRVGLQ